MADKSADEEKCILCAHRDLTMMPVCGKWGTKYCSLLYTILNIFVCSLIVHLIGFSTSYWSHGEDFYHNGLWQLCGLNKQRYCRYLPYDAAWFEATQALETLGLFAAFLSLVLLVLFIFHPQSTTNKAILIVATVSTFVAACFTVLGVVIYGTKNGDLSWSYGVTVLAGILYTGSGILMVIHLSMNVQNT